jgi:hypothetical protein
MEIEFYLNHGAFTTLAIYNTKGQKVQTLVSSSIGPGIHRSILDGSKIISGLYFLHLSANGKDCTHPILFTR